MSTSRSMLACVGIEFGVGIATEIDESMKTQAAAVQEGLNRPGCTTEVTDKQQTPEHEIIIPAGQTYTTIEALDVPFLMTYFSVDPKPVNFVHPNGIREVGKVVYGTDP